MQKISISRFQLGHVFHLVFFIVGLSVGISISLYFKSFLLLLQAKTISNSSLQTRPFMFQLPPSLPPPPPAEPPAPDRGSVEPEIKPNLLHYMNDNELFSRALTAPSNRRSPQKHVPKVAFMFLSKGPIPLAPLWEMFFKGHEGLYTIYVHSHPSYVDSTPENSVFYKRRIPSEPVEWGTSTMVDAERRLLANALLDDSSNERFVLLSETCIPLLNLTTTYSYLTNAHESFTASHDDPRKSGRGRYNPEMSPTISISEWRKGSQWFEVSRKIALEIISDTKYYPIFLEHCRPPCYMDEHYIPTLINIICPKENSNRTITWVDWSKSGPHPGRFGSNDVSEEFLNQIRFGSNCTYNGNTTTLCFLFARKFLPNTLQPLLQFAPLLLNTSVQV